MNTWKDDLKEYAVLGGLLLAYSVSMWFVLGYFYPNG